MPVKPNKSGERPDPRRGQLARIHMLRKQLLDSGRGFSEEIYRDIIAQVKPGCESSADLSDRERLQLIDRLANLAGEKKKPGKSWSYPGRPKNMDKRGQSRDEQLGKIEALLTIGGLPWSYADGIAKQMRLADKVQWVEEADLYRIITALTKKAQKEGWDLSGAK